MRNKALGILVLIVGLSILSYSRPITCNPIWVPDLSVGGLWNTGTNIQMPFANVHIQINYMGQATFDIEMIGNFTILTNITQECMLAFAYPASWRDGSDQIAEMLFDITLDDSPLITWPLEIENASWIYIWEKDKFYQMSCAPDYIGFNVSLEADTNHTLEVRTSFRKMGDVLDIGYVCGTAWSFDGSTSETITMVVNQSTPLSQIAFYPPWNRTIINESFCSTAIWNLSFLDPWPMDGDYSPVDAVHSILETFETYTPPTTTTELPQSTSTTTTPTTTPAPPISTATPIIQQNAIGRFVIGVALGLAICVLTVVMFRIRRV